MKFLNNIKAKLSNALSMDELRNSKLLAPVFLWYEGLPPDHKNIANISVLAGVILTLFFFLFTGTQKVDALREEITAKQQNLKNLVQYEEQFHTQSSLLKRLERDAKRKSGDFSILSALENLARNAGIGRESIESISPKELSPGDYFIETEATVKLARVTLKEATKYFYYIENSPNNLSLKEVRVKPRFDDPNQLNITFKVSAFKPKK